MASTVPSTHTFPSRARSVCSPVRKASLSYSSIPQLLPQAFADTPSPQPLWLAPSGGAFSVLAGRTVPSHPCHPHNGRDRHRTGSTPVLEHNAFKTKRRTLLQGAGCWGKCSHRAVVSKVSKNLPMGKTLRKKSYIMQNKLGGKQCKMNAKGQGECIVFYLSAQC